MDQQVIENTSGLEPVGQAVLVKPYNPEVAASQIVLPDNIKRRMETLDLRVIIVAIGEDAWEGRPARAKVGDKVLVSAFCGAMLVGPWDDEQYRMVNGRDIFGRITQERSTKPIVQSMDRTPVRINEQETAAGEI